MRTWFEQLSPLDWRLFWMTEEEVLFSAVVKIHPGQVPHEAGIIQYFKTQKDWFIEMVPQPPKENKETEIIKKENES